MYALNITYGRKDSTKVFLFKEEAPAKANHDALIKNDGKHQFSDDFGQTAHFAANCITASFVENMELTAEAHMEFAVHNAVLQAKAQNRVMADPMVQAAQRLGGMMPGSQRLG